MNWDDLRLFLAVARAGSISGGARSLGLQHSTLSRRMRKLEHGLGARLFDRTRKGYELTAAGQDLLDAAVRMETEVLGVDGRLSGKDLQLLGSLRVTAVDNMATTVLMPIFASFSRLHPDIQLHVMISNSDVSLSQREADLAIRLTNLPPETLIGKRIATVSSCIYGSHEYLARLKKQAEKPRWLGVECCRFHQSWTRQAREQQAHNFYVDDTLLTQAALREGLGISILPCFLGDPDPALARYGAPDPAWNLGLWILMHPDLKRTARVLAFRNHLMEAVKQISDVFQGTRPTH